jgi:hypothetical protein
MVISDEFCADRDLRSRMTDGRGSGIRPGSWSCPKARVVAQCCEAKCGAPIYDRDVETCYLCRDGADVGWLSSRQALRAAEETGHWPPRTLTPRS